jgi:hypothetical protein
MSRVLEIFEHGAMTDEAKDEAISSVSFANMGAKDDHLVITCVNSKSREFWRRAIESLRTPDLIPRFRAWENGESDRLLITFGCRMSATAPGDAERESWWEFILKANPLLFSSEVLKDPMTHYLHGFIQDERVFLAGSLPLSQDLKLHGAKNVHAPMGFASLHRGTWQPRAMPTFGASRPQHQAPSQSTSIPIPISVPSEQGMPVQGDKAQSTALDLTAVSKGPVPSASVFPKPNSLQSSKPSYKARKRPIPRGFRGLSIAELEARGREYAAELANWELGIDREGADPRDEKCQSRHPCAGFIPKAMERSHVAWHHRRWAILTYLSAYQENADSVELPSEKLERGRPEGTGKAKAKRVASSSAHRSVERQKRPDTSTTPSTMAAEEGCKTTPSAAVRAPLDDPLPLILSTEVNTSTSLIPNSLSPSLSQSQSTSSEHSDAEEVMSEK